MPKTDKERMQIPRQEMPTRSPEARKTGFDEVAEGYTIEMAITEANRCLQCNSPQCIKGCPVMVRIPEFILALRENDPWGAAAVLKDTNSLPALCGRVCPEG